MQDCSAYDQEHLESQSTEHVLQLNLNFVTQDLRSLSLCLGSCDLYLVLDHCDVGLESKMVCLLKGIPALSHFVLLSLAKI